MTDKARVQCSSKANMTQYLWVSKSYKLWRMFFVNASGVYLGESSSSYARPCVGENIIKIGLKKPCMLCDTCAFLFVIQTGTQSSCYPQAKWLYWKISTFLVILWYLQSYLAYLHILSMRTAIATRDMKHTKEKQAHVTCGSSKKKQNNNNPFGWVSQRWSHRCEEIQSWQSVNVLWSRLGMRVSAEASS